MRRPALPVLVAVMILAVTLLGCSTSPDVEQARVAEQRAETIVETIEALPAGTPGKQELLADARAAEAKLEAMREALEKLTKDSLVAQGLDLGGDVISGDYLGALGTLLGTLGAGAVLALRRRLSVDLPELEQRLADAQSRLESTLELQGIAASNARSAEAAQSPVAIAAKLAREAEMADAVSRALASSTITPPASPLAPTSPAPTSPPAARTAEDPAA